METIRKKVSVLRASLTEAEDRANKAEKELEKAEERNKKVRKFFTIRSLFLSQK